MVKNLNKIRLSKSSISEKELDAVSSVLRKEYLGMGTEVSAFENELSNFFEVPNKNIAIVSSGTAALHLALESLDLDDGSEVLVPSITYVASYQAITAARLKPVSCDVDLDSMLISCESSKSKLSEKTRAIMIVHYGSNCDIPKKLYDFALQNELHIIHDAAHSFGCDNLNINKSAKNEIYCFSFDGIKNITSGEGGAVISFNQANIDSVRDSRLLGVHKDSEKRVNRERSWTFDVLRQGYRYHMSEIFAAIGRVQLERFSDFKNHRRKILNKYLDTLHHPKITIPNFYQENIQSIVPHIFCVRVHSGRDDLREFLLTKGIETGIHYYPNHLLTKFSNNESLVNSELFFSEAITLPMHFDLKLSEVERICSEIEAFFLNQK